MQLTYVSDYLSIVDFPSATLPSFTLLTGVNGAGKTHLLKALAQGSVRVDIAPQFQTEVRFFDWNTFVPQDQGLYDGHNLVQQHAQLMSQFENAFNSHKGQFIQAGRQIGLPHELIQNPQKLAGISKQELETYLPPDQIEQAFDQLEGTRKAVSSNIISFLSTSGYPQANKLLNHLAEKIGRSVPSLTREDFFNESPVAWGQTDLFQQSLAQLFVAYRDQWASNGLRILAQQNGEANSNPLTQEEFIARYNIPPWDFVNRILRDAGLGFYINHPDLYQLTPYQPRLTKTSSGAQMLFNDLSSGEKVLMSFALCLYYAEDQRQLAIYPKLLLLDEIDAPLHPSMSRSLIDAILNTLVKRFNIHVILTTHSPSTVAITPEESVFVMRPNQPGIHKVTKTEALNVLTEGIPTLSVSFDGRRQVFVESHCDAKVLDTIYQNLRSYLNSERSLVFIPVGYRPARGGDQNSGCDQVKRVVQELASGGNKSVLGMIDWDGDKNPSDRVFVLAHNERNGIENCVFDPLLVAIQVARDIQAKSGQIGLQLNETYLDIKHFQPARLQQLVDAVCTLTGATSGSTISQKYLGDIELHIPVSYIQMDDHKLEELLIQQFPEFNQYNRHSGDLLHRFASTTMRELPRFIPSVFKDAFQQMLNISL